MPRVATIGAVDFDRESFVSALRAAGVTRLVDLRRRRMMRGSTYSWTNSQRLQAAMREAGIEYAHLVDLAPSADLLKFQHEADKAARVSPRARAALDPEYVRRFRAENLAGIDAEALLEAVDAPAGGIAALLCVEPDPATCHRSLVASWLAENAGFEVVHLRA